VGRVLVPQALVRRALVRRGMCFAIDSGVCPSGSLVSQYEPTTEYLALLPELAKEVWAKRQERAKQDSRALNIRLQEQKHLNSQAIKAKLKGELSAEDFAAFSLFRAGYSQPISLFGQLLNVSRWPQSCDHSVTSADVRLSVGSATEIA